MQPAALDPVQHVIAKVLDGLTLRKALNELQLSPQQFETILRHDKAAALAYARAAELRADLLADEVVEIADSDVDPAMARNRMTARQWLASKLHSKRYGDRIDLNVTQTLDIGGTLAEARARIALPIRDQLDSNVTDVPMQIAQSVDNHTLPVEPGASPPPLVPDIFS